MLTLKPVPVPINLSEWKKVPYPYKLNKENIVLLFFVGQTALWPTLSLKRDKFSVKNKHKIMIFRYKNCKSVKTKEACTDTTSKTLKGQCHEIFCHFLFHESNSSRPLINRLKWFCLKIRFRGVSLRGIEFSNFKF